MRFWAAFATAFLVGIGVQVAVAADGRGFPRGGGGASRNTLTTTTLNVTTVNATTDIATTGKFALLDAGSGMISGPLQLMGTLAPVAAPDDGGTSMTVRFQYGYGVLSSNDYSVTFNPAFAGIPACNCSAVNATAAKCGLKAIPSASAAVFRGENASDAIYWDCKGPK